MRKLLVTVLVAASVMAGSGVSHAGGPTIERIPINESGTDPQLTAYCGFDVTYTYKGSMMLRTFSDRASGLVELTNLNAVATVSANGKSFSGRDVGADIVRVAADGSVIIAVVGRIPFSFTGALKYDPETGEVFLEPHHDLSPEADTACAALAA